MSKIIDIFRGEYGFLSNFERSKVLLDGVAYPTVEHGFQAAKTFDADERRLICNAASPTAAKRLGRKVKLREDWEDVKVDVMYQLLKQKFSIPELRAKLLETGDAEIIEGNDHGDRTWGQVNGVGKNLLGKLIMKVRDEIRDEFPISNEEIL